MAPHHMIAFLPVGTAAHDLGDNLGAVVTTGESPAAANPRVQVILGTKLVKTINK